MKNIEIKVLPNYFLNSAGTFLLNAIYEKKNLEILNLNSFIFKW